ncbi:hypothetical protein P8X24_01055 [Pyrococcus kukulkanii]|uniref:hypothetical protein n=1 Tax=Pyrococcus kukulkanii TaxID=1609559 RepID=UPI003566EA59
MNVLFVVIALTIVYFAFLYTSLKNMGGLKGERGRRINPIAAEKTLIFLQALLLAGLVGIDVGVLDPKSIVVMAYIVAIVGHVLLRYYYSRVM